MSIKPFLLTHREVCARRARKLRKRGEDVYFHHSTPNGKERWRKKSNRQRKELRRLNAYISAYWKGFRLGGYLKAEARMRSIMAAKFGWSAVNEAEHAAIDAAKAGT